MALSQTDTQTGFARQLKNWRAARKLSQLELAMTAGVSQRHISFLEVGRAQPSREMVGQLAAALDIPMREQNLLLSAAGFAPVHTETALQDPSMEAVRRALDMMLTHHEPFPATVADRAWNLLQANAAMGRLLALVGDTDALWNRVGPDGERNLLKLVLHPEGLRPYIGNWNEVAAELMARTHREAEITGSVALRELVTVVSDYPGMRPEWTLTQWGYRPAPVLPVRFVRDDLELNVFTTLTTFGTPLDITTDELRVEAYFPADEATDQFLRLLAA